MSQLLQCCYIIEVPTFSKKTSNFFFISILLFIFARVYITERHKETASDETKI